MLKTWPLSTDMRAITEFHKSKFGMNPLATVLVLA